jgi:hypothetical protein
MSAKNFSFLLSALQGNEEAQADLYLLLDAPWVHRDRMALHLIELNPALYEYVEKKVMAKQRVCKCGQPESEEAWAKGGRGCPTCGAVWPENLHAFAKRTDPGRGE